MIPGLTVEARPDAVWVRSTRELRTLSSGLVRGGFARVRHVLNMHVHRDYHGERPEDDLAAFAATLGLGGPFVGLMTAARTHEAIVVEAADDGVAVLVVATVGVTVAEAAGLSRPVGSRPATINLIVLLDARLGAAAAVNGVITATEAKAGALLEARVTTPEGYPATGTVTDAVVIGWTGRGRRLPYLGPCAPGGALVARVVRDAVSRGIGRP